MDDLKFQVVTVATDLNKAGTLVESSKSLGIPILNLGKNISWNGSGPQKKGGGQKINLMKGFLSALDDNRIILFLDGYDVLINSHISEIVKKFFEFNVDIVFSAEKTWRHEGSLVDKFPKAKSDYRYLSSGAYMGFSESLKRLFETPLADDDDDQFYLSEAYLKNLQSVGGVHVALDTEATIFQCVSAAADDIVVEDDKRLLNKKTSGRPCVLHGNGDEADKRNFAKLCASLGFGPTHIQFSPTNGKFDVIGPEIIMMDFLTRAECIKLIAMAEEYGEWKSLDGDKYPGQEIRLRALDINLFNKLEAHFTRDLFKIVEKYWWPTLMHGLRDAFIIKFSPETQASLACHTDASMVSGIVKLNDDYEGGETWFHRQQFSTKYAPVGKMMLWPGQVTHGHEGSEVTAGTKYSLVIWTSRTKNDLNY